MLWRCMKMDDGRVILLHLRDINSIPFSNERNTKEIKMYVNLTKKRDNIVSLTKFSLTSIISSATTCHLFLIYAADAIRCTEYEMETEAVALLIVYTRILLK